MNILKKTISFTLISINFILSTLNGYEINFKSQEELDRKISEVPSEALPLKELVLVQEWDRISCGPDCSQGLLRVVDFSILSQFEELEVFQFSPKYNFFHSSGPKFLESLSTLPEFPALKKIKISNALINPYASGEGEDFQDILNLLSKYSDLISIDLSSNSMLLSGSPIDKFYDFSTLATLTHLESLNLNGSFGGAGDHPLPGISSLQSLKHISLQGMESYDDLEEVLKLENLEELTIPMVPYSRRGERKPEYRELSSYFSVPLLQLKKLSVQSYWIQDTNGANWTSINCAAFVPNLESFEIFQLDFSQMDARELSNFSNLKSLSILCSNLTKENIIELSQVTLPNLQALTIENTHTRGFEVSKFAPELKYLRLENTDTGNAILSSIANLIYLEELTIVNAPITGSGLKKLSKLPLLKKLSLQSLDLSTANFADLASVEELDLKGSKLSLTSLPTLKALIGLKKLNLRVDAKHLTPEFIEELRRALPETEIST